MSETKTVSEYLKYDFSEDETSANAKKLARTNRALAEHGLKKKQLATDLKQQEEGLNSEIAELSRFVTDGYDFRMIECRVHYNMPRPGNKTIVRTDTGEVVREDRMSPAEVTEQNQEKMF